MSLFKKIFGRSKKKSKKIVRKSILEITNKERQRIIENDEPLSAAMKLLAGITLSQAEAKAAIKSGAFGNVFNRHLAATYDSAQTNNLNVNHWTAADDLAADAANTPAIRKIISKRARYECANNCIAKGMGESISLDVIGTGPCLHVDDDRLVSLIKQEIEIKFNAWLQETRLAEKLRTMRRARRVDGEAFAIKITNNKLKHPVKLDIKLIEAEMVATPDLALADDRKIDGIDLDENGNPERYHLRKGHPGDPGQSADAQKTYPVEAKDMIHWFRQDRPGQHRGISEMTAGLPLYALLRRYNLAVVHAAETAADFAMWLGTTLGADGMTDPDEDIIEVPNTFDLFPLQRNMVTTLPDGYSIGQTKPEQPINTHDKFVISIIREIARNESVSLNIALGDSSKSNFSSGNLDHRIYYRPREIERSELNNIILDNLFQDWITEAALIDGYLPDVMNKAWSDLRHSWQWDTNELGDPLKLAASKATLLKNGLTTIPELYSARNQDWRKAFSDAATSLGVTVEEYQEMVRDAIFAGGSEVDVGDDEEDEEKNSEPVRQQPQQNATRKANQK